MKKMENDVIWVLSHLREIVVSILLAVFLLCSLCFAYGEMKYKYNKKKKYEDKIWMLQKESARNSW
jgi:hypothetical protein